MAKIKTEYSEGSFFAVIYWNLHAELPYKNMTQWTYCGLEKVLFYPPLRLIDPLFELKGSQLTPVDSWSWVHTSAFERQAGILITFLRRRFENSGRIDILKENLETLEKNLNYSFNWYKKTGISVRNDGNL